MYKLESRPINGNPWEEMFYVDVEGNLADDNMKIAIAELKQTAGMLKVLGCYPAESFKPVTINKP